MTPSEPPKLTLRQGLWFVALIATLNLSGIDSAIVGVRIPYVLTNDLRQSAETLARFRQIVALPAAFGVLYGVLRDRWPWGDRRLLLAALPAYLLAPLIPWAGLSYERLLSGTVVGALAAGVMGAAANGTLAALGRRFQAVDRLAVLWLALGAITGALTTEVGGALSAFPFRVSLGFVAAFGFAFFLLVLRPTAGAFPPSDAPPTAGEGAVRAFARLLRSGPLWLALLYTSLWNFSPAWWTPYTVRLKDDLHLSEAQFAHVGSLTQLAVVPGILLYALLVRRFSHRAILGVGPLLVLPLILTALVMRTPGEAYGVAVTGGLASGTLNAASYALILRALPRGLEGTGLALVATVGTLLNGEGDVWATGLTQRHGYAVAVWITLATTVLMVPLAFRLPARVAEETPRE